MRPLPLFLSCLPFLLGGCSLLFVAKGRTDISSTKEAPVPTAVSLEKEMSKKVVLHYEVKPGDSWEFLAEAYYGSSKKAKALARANRMDPAKKPPVGRTISIAEPVYFPNGKEMDAKREQSAKKAKGPAAAQTPPSDLGEADTAQDEKDVALVPRPRANKAFGSGEKLTFEVRAIGVLGGYATLSVEDYKKVQGRPCYPLVARAKTAFPFSTFYPVNDVQTSFFDVVDFITWGFENDVHEGDYQARNRETYDQLKHRLTRQHNQEPVEDLDVQPFTQDIISCFYYFRLLPLEVGKKYLIPTCSGGKNYKLIVKVVGRERVKCPAGTFDCFKAKPFVKYGTVFRNKEDIDLWVTADDRHIPVRIKSAIVIGSIDVSLLDAVVPDMSGDGGKLTSRVSN
ncbi:MAG TPA: DUF3108 domain-containing protein [bacterium]|nr:DUF3108 domain-containing protein [bacterium]